MTNHPITPLPELVEEWATMLEYHPDEKVFSEVAQWGADQQLTEDAKWLDQHAFDAPHLKITPMGKSLKEAMRPKPLTLKEQALEALKVIECEYVIGVTTSTIRRALEALPND